MPEFSRLVPVEVFDNEASQLISNNTRMMHVAVRELVGIYQTVKAVNGRAGEVWLNKGDIGLANVANLTPANYPLSDAAVQALATKMDLNAELTTSRITGLDTALAARVKSVNGNVPDASGNVQLQLTSGSYIPTWEGEVTDQEVPVYFKPTGQSGAWTHRPLPTLLAGQLVPIPAADNSDDGKVAKIVGNAWTKVTPPTPPTAAQLLPSVTTADNDKTLRVVGGAWAPATVPALPTVTTADNSKVATVVAGAWAVAALPPGPSASQLLPAVTAADNDKVLKVVGGSWTAATAPTPPTAAQLLPTPVAADAGKVMQVQPSGAFALTEFQLRSPNGTLYKLTVSDAGALTATAV